MEYLRLSTGPSLIPSLVSPRTSITKTGEQSATSPSFRCFICWEGTENEANIVHPCRCKNENLMFAHEKCIDRWVNDTGKTHCAVCMSSYMTELKPIPFVTILHQNSWLILSFLFQVTLPTSVYILLYFNGSLTKLNPWFIAGHLITLTCMYSLFAMQVLSRIQRYKVNVISVDHVV